MHIVVIMIYTTIMNITHPNITHTHIVQGMPKEGLPGFYNSTCGLYGTVCFTQLNLKCEDFRCVCFDNYVPNDTGGCEQDMITVLVTWIIRIFVCACVFFLCFIVFHFIVSRTCGRRERLQLEEEDDAENRRNSTSTCWYDEPPTYLDVTEETPPPTYQEAVEKERESGCEAPTRVPERATPRSNALNPARRGREPARATAPPCPAPPHIAPSDTQAYQTVHI